MAVDINATFTALVEARTGPRHQRFQPDRTWQHGKVWRHAPDAAYTLERDELNAPFRRAHVPTAAFMDRPVGGPPCCTPVATHDAHAHRIATIDRWVRRRHKGDVQRALRQNPVVLTQQPNGQLDLVDGYHRTLHAMAHGHTHVPAVIVQTDRKRHW